MKMLKMSLNLLVWNSYHLSHAETIAPKQFYFEKKSKGCILKAHHTLEIPVLMES